MKKVYLAMPPIVTAALVGMLGCDSPVHVGDIEPNFLILRENCYDPDDPQCLNTYPLDDDPDPTAPGYYIGSGYTMENCLAIFTTDADGDGFDDKCEYRLAHTFAPHLRVAANDPALSREPYWAATYRPDNYYPAIVEHVSIIYALAYHRDTGWPTGHYGDSEFIIVDLLYNAANGHWQLWQVFTSAHWSTPGDLSEYSGFADIEYPHRTRGYPRVYVAINKHANYRSKARCDAWQDSCPNPVDEATRVPVVQSRNLGSSDIHFINNVASVTPYSYGGTENFWSGAKFCGWHLATDCAGSYSGVLSAFNF